MLGDERITLRVFDAIQIQIRVKLRPEQMFAVMQLDREQLVQGRLPKPRELLEIQKVLASRNEDPESVRRDVQYFNLRNVAANDL